MRRQFYQFLKDWQKSEKRRPLMLRGARQVGKTYLLKEFARNSFTHHHYLNFEKEEDLKEAFQGSLDPKEVLRLLALITGKRIDTGDLLIFDEIQACPRALTSLKYFAEEMPELHICSAGSLLGVHLGEGSFPVGKVNIVDLFPMNFQEFMLALGEDALVEALKNLAHDSLPPSVHTKILSILKQYFVVGGLPEAVELYANSQNDQEVAFAKVRDLQDTLYQAYLADMAKHSGKANALHIDQVFNSIPAQLGRTTDGSSTKYRFKDIIKNGRYNRLIGPINWLVAAGLAHKVYIVNHAALPLAAHVKENAFKLQMFDIGMLGSVAKLDPLSIMRSDYGTYKGYFIENYILQSLISNRIGSFYCWQEGTAEIEFLLDFDGKITPIEVKAGNRSRSKSLRVFSDKYHPPRRIVFSSLPYKVSACGGVHSYPHYYASFIKNARQLLDH